MKNLLASATEITARNKRYVVWFYLFNLLLAGVGAGAFSSSAHDVLDHSMYSDRLLHGFNLLTFVELLARPEFGPTKTSTAPGVTLAILFFLLTLIFMPGVLLGYASDHRISREEFYRTCGRNIWRFVRIFLFFVIIAGPTAAILFGIHKGLVNLADKSTYEKASFYTAVVTLAVIFVILSAIRAWFDLAETDVVVNDKHVVRKAIGAAFRTMRRRGAGLVGTYVMIGLIAGITLLIGLALWEMIVPASSVVGAFIIAQATLLLLLAARFWQRAAAVALYLRQQAEAPVLDVQPIRTVAPEVPVAQQN